MIFGGFEHNCGLLKVAILVVELHYFDSLDFIMIFIVSIIPFLDLFVIELVVMVFSVVVILFKLMK